MRRGRRLSYLKLGCIADAVAVALGSGVAEGSVPLLRFGMAGVGDVSAEVTERCRPRADAYAAPRAASEPIAECAVGTSIGAIVAWMTYRAVEVRGFASYPPSVPLGTPS